MQEISSRKCGANKLPRAKGKLPWSAGSRWSSVHHGGNKTPAARRPKTLLRLREAVVARPVPASIALEFMGAQVRAAAGAALPQGLLPGCAEAGRRAREGALQ